MVVIAVVLGALIGIRNSGMKQNEGLFSISGIRGIGTQPDSSDDSVLGVSLMDSIIESQEQGSDIFEALRLERSKTRSRSMETLEMVARDTGLSDEARAAAGMQLVDLSKRTEAEAEAEALIRARGYEDALIFVRGDACDVVISGPELSKADAEQIGDIAARCLGVDLANITIVERGKP